MQYHKYLLKEDSVQKALSLPEPKVGENYAPEKVERYIKIIDSALEKMKSKKENDANDAIIQDLRNKRKAWGNVDKETKPVKVKKEEPPPEQAPPQQESKLCLYLKNKE